MWPFKKKKYEIQVLKRVAIKEGDLLIVEVDQSRGIEHVNIKQVRECFEQAINVMGISGVQVLVSPAPITLKLVRNFSKIDGIEKAQDRLSK